MRISTVLAAIGSVVATTPAFAGVEVPLPIAGAAGPIGIAAVVAGYLGYRVFRSKK